MAAARKTEKSPLMDEFCDHVHKAYAPDSHATYVDCKYGVKSIIANYEPLKLSSFRVLTSFRGSVLQDPILCTEQGLILLIFFSCALPVYIYFNRKTAMGDGDESMRKWVDGQDERMRAFAMIMTFLASLLLSFYTAMAVGRWWVMRTAGIGGIKSAAMELELLISQQVTQDTKVLDSIRRYARASLILVFLWRRKRQSKELMMEGLKDILDEGEVDKLFAWNHMNGLHEVIWSWQTAIVCMLYNEGKIKSDPLLKTLLERCADGRQAVQVIHTHLAVKIPMTYVHLLGFLVKMHNAILAVIMGVLFGAAVRNAETIICCQLIGRTLILPVLFNAILLINAELSDPFSGHQTDFPATAYQNALEKDGSAVLAAGRNMPDWMKQRTPLPT